MIGTLFGYVFGDFCVNSGEELWAGHGKFILLLRGIVFF